MTDTHEHHEAPGAPTEERVAEGVEHLQAAARELIAAARAFLDVADEYVRDPQRMTEVASAAGVFLETLAGRDHGRPGGRGPSGTDPGGGPSRVHHIHVD